MPNTITITGRLAADIDLRFTPSGDTVANGRVADTPRKFDRDRNEWSDSGETLWLGFSLWGKKAEALAEVGRKGELVMVTGTLTQRTYEGKHGEQRVSIEVKASEVAVVPRVQSGAGWSKDSSRTADPWAQPVPSDTPPF